MVLNGRSGIVSITMRCPVASRKWCEKWVANSIMTSPLDLCNELPECCGRGAKARGHAGFHRMLPNQTYGICQTTCERLVTQHLQNTDMNNLRRTFEGGGRLRRYANKRNRARSNCHSRNDRFRGRSDELHLYLKTRNSCMFSLIVCKVKLCTNPDPLEGKAHRYRLHL